VFRAIEKVFASFYNENAWLERLRHGVREQDTGMAILVHQNFPDALEMANGVVTFKYQRSRFGDQQETNYSASIVTQLGALSVTNPEGGGYRLPRFIWEHSRTPKRGGLCWAPDAWQAILGRSISIARILVAW